MTMLQNEKESFEDDKAKLSNDVKVHIKDLDEWKKKYENEARLRVEEVGFVRSLKC